MSGESSIFAGHIRIMDTMKVSEQTLQQIARALRKVAAKLSDNSVEPHFTDIFLQVKQESGELLAFDDDDKELTRCVVEEWIGNSDEHFYEEIQAPLRQCIAQFKDTWEEINVLKPFSFVLVGEDHETIADLYLVDDDVVILDGELMAGLEDDLNAFWEKLEKQ